eukprot:scaffold144319_cov21-Tisochrysis_lutea.AAC.2
MSKTGWGHSATRGAVQLQWVYQLLLQVFDVCILSHHNEHSHAFKPNDYAGSKSISRPTVVAVGKEKVSQLQKDSGVPA